MAGPWFVRSGAGGAGTGADWANAFATLTAANTASTAGGGETFWIADDHAESTAAAITLTSKGVTTNPNFYYCVDHTKASPGSGDLLTTATITTTAALTTTDTLNAFVLPKGFRVLYSMLLSSDIDTNGTPTIALNVGDAGSATRYFSASTVGQAGTAAAATATTGIGFLNTADTLVTVVPSANAATGVAGTVQLIMIGRYEGTAS
jgi:hypothetical protein